MESSNSSSNRNKRSSSSKGFLKGKLQAMSLLHKPTPKPLPPSSGSGSTTNTKLKPSTTPTVPLLIHQLDDAAPPKHIFIKSSAALVPPPPPIKFNAAASSSHPHPHPHPQAAAGRVAITVHQDQSLPQPTHRLSVHVLSTTEHHQNASAAVVGHEPSMKHVKGNYHLHHPHPHPHPHPVDENVDLKATDYISSVKERFRVPMC